MVTKAISIPMAEHMNQTSLYLQSKVIVLQILSDESCNLATQLGSRKLVEKFILGGFNYYSNTVYSIPHGYTSELIMYIAMPDKC